MDLNLIITIPFPLDENLTRVVDAVNETLNTLAHEGALEDSNDDAWSWSVRRHGAAVAEPIR